jgi:hypothetical protein
VAGVLPLFGFYLQPAVGGRVLSYTFWRRFLEIDAVAAIKVAPFNRYRTFDVLRAAAGAGPARRGLVHRQPQPGEVTEANVSVFDAGASTGHT